MTPPKESANTDRPRQWSNPKKDRFEDDGSALHEFTDVVLVHCPSCDACARVFIKNDSGGVGVKAMHRHRELFFAERRLQCDKCGYVKDWQGTKLALGSLKDAHFEQPLWLITQCCGETLWAYNERHLDFLRDFVSAKLRRPDKNRTRSAANRIPAWIQLGKNRDEVLKCIEQFRSTIPK